jgi:serine/threonine protein kinase
VDRQPDPDIQIAGYRIEARLGRGGMGEVYQAVQLSLDRRVALKVLPPKLAADDVFRRRFLRESRIAASIDHPSIIPIYETGEDGGLLYIAMRYVDGMDLSTLLRREGRLAPARALAIMAQVASALDAAHARGLVHRDVKPGNILLAAGPVGSDGHCYLCDFGLIKEVDVQQARSALTATGQFVGTIPYVAPEQIEGGALDGRADVYSLGCVLFHCLTGSPPFDRINDIEVVFAHLREPPPSVSSRAPGLPKALDAIVARAMAKSRDDRWPTCTALVTAMQSELGSSAPAPPPTSADAETRSMQMPPVRGRSPSAGPGGAQPAAAAPSGTAPPGAAPPGTSPPGTAPPAAGGPAAAAPAAAGVPALTDVSPPKAAPAVDPDALTRIEPGSPSPFAPPPAAPPPAAPPPAWRDPGSPAVAAPPADAAPPAWREPGVAPPSAGRPEPARPASGPPEGERSGPGGGGPAAVHRDGGGRRRGRWGLVAAAIVLPVAAYVGATQYLSDEAPQVVAAPETTVAVTSPPGGSTCPSTIARPKPSTPTRTAPLDAIRDHEGWTEAFVVREMRTWRASDGQRQWYVKAYQEDEESRRGRWLVGQEPEAQPRVLASADYSTRGYKASDWEVADGQEAPTGIAGCLTGT